jgi:hypothetical protein
MGRHGRPERVRRAQMTAFRAAAAVGVAGTLAFAVQSVGKDVVVQAQSDSPYEPTSDPSDLGTTPHHHSGGGQAQTPGSRNGMATSFSAAPKVLQPVKHAGSAARTAVGGLQGNSVPQPAATTAMPQPGVPGASAQGSSDSSGSTTPDQLPTQAQPPADSGGSGGSSSSQNGGSSAQSGGSLTGVVGGLVGGVTHGIGGLLGG